MLKITNLSKSFGSKKILNNVSLDLAPGEIAILLGSSGVGKSTLMRVLNNLETFESGTVTLDGAPLDLATISHTHTIGMVFQHFHLFDHLTALENITLALIHVQKMAAAHAQTIAYTLLAHYGLKDKAHSYPRDLSGGQKQRLALARMLALKPRIVCLDEPTSALDPVLTAHVAQTIKQLAHEGYTVLITTHDTSLVQFLPQSTLHLMKDGRILESAPAGSYAKNPELFNHVHQFISGNSTT